MAGIKFTIDAENRSAAAVGQAIQGVQRYEAELRKLKAAGDQSTDGQTRLGQAVLNVAQAKQRATQATRTLTQGQSALTEAARGATAALGAQAGPLGGLVTSLSGMNLAAGAVAAVVAALGVAMISATRGVADYQEQADLAAASTGFTTQEIGGLRVAASETGRSFEQLRPALDFFSRRIGEAATGSKDAIKAFASLGVSIRDADGKIRPIGETFRDVQAALTELEAGPARSQKSFEVFGRGASASLGALLVPMDAAIDRAKKLGIAFGPEAEAVARRADIAFDQLGLSVMAIGNSFGVLSATILGPFLSSLATASSKVAEFVNSPEFKLFLAVGRAGISLPGIPNFKSKGGEASAIEQAVGELTLKQVQDYISKQRAEGALPAAARTGYDAAIGPKQVGAIEVFKEAVDKFASSIPSGTGIFGSEWGRSPVRDPMAGFSPYVSNFGPGFTPPPFTPTHMPDIPGIKFNEDMFADNEAAIKALGARLEDSFASFVSDAILGVGSLKDAFNSFLRSVVDDLIEMGAKALVKVAIGFVAGGPAGAAVSGATLAQHGGTVAFDNFHPIMAQAGLVVSGVRGRDTVPALLGKGETVIDHSLTDSLRALIPKLDGFVRDGRASGGDTFAPTINLTVNEAQLRGRRLEDYLSDELIPRMDEARRSGRLRR